MITFRSGLSAAVLLFAAASLEEPALAATSPARVPTLLIELTDGSRLRGRPQTNQYVWRTVVGPVPVAWETVTALRPARDQERVPLILEGGHQLYVETGTNTLALTTLFGTVQVSFSVMQELRVESVGGAPASPGTVTRPSTTTSRGGTTNPVARWTFDDAAQPGHDDSGNGHELTAVGATTAPGRVGRGIATGGQGYGNHLKGPADPALEFIGDFTMTLWANRSAPLYDGDELIAKEGEFSLRRASVPQEQLVATLSARDGTVLARVENRANPLPLNRWRFIAVYRRGDRLGLRIDDGAPVEVQVTAGDVGGTKPLFIGASSSGYPWQGRIDEITRWNRALSKESLDAEFTRGSTTEVESGGPPRLPRFRPANPPR